MSFKHIEPVFQSEVVKYENGIRSIIDHVPSKYLTDKNGNYVIDPTSPTGEPYIVPANMDFDKTIEEFTELFINTPITSALLLANFQTGGSFDLQRTGINGEPYGGFVSDYTPSASLYFGAVSAALTVPANIAEIGGGLLNLKNSLSNDSINTSGNYWNNPNNVQNIREGLSYYQNNISTNPSIDSLLNALDMLLDLAHALNPASHLDDFINDLFNAAIQAKYGSPLTLDLDGDGIETVGIDVNHLVLFDNNNDGIKTATGWVKSDDALLVLDRNANGTIDNGSELFGDNTLIYDSNNQSIEKAANGFDALAQYDTDNNGKIDETDSIYINLKIWQDYNQDGISQANELSSLNANAITSIGLSYETSSIISNNNLYALKGTYQKDNATQTITDIYFIQENFYREFIDTIPLTEAASVLPQMQGSGVVRVNNIDFKNVRRVA